MLKLLNMGHDTVDVEIINCKILKAFDFILLVYRILPFTKFRLRYYRWYSVFFLFKHRIRF